MDEFNDLLSKNELSEEQLNVCRDIRRRGKNKVAAQNCRQRKIEQIDELQLKLKKAVDRRDKVKYEHDRSGGPVTLHFCIEPSLNLDSTTFIRWRPRDLRSCLRQFSIILTRTI